MTKNNKAVEKLRRELNLLSEENNSNKCTLLNLGHPQNV